jgi:hypothetical protein
MSTAISATSACPSSTRWISAPGSKCSSTASGAPSIPATTSHASAGLSSREVATRRTSRLSFHSVRMCRSRFAFGPTKFSVLGGRKGKSGWLTADDRFELRIHAWDFPTSAERLQWGETGRSRGVSASSGCAWPLLGMDRELRSGSLRGFRHFKPERSENGCAATHQKLNLLEREPRAQTPRLTERGDCFFLPSKPIGGER